MKLVSRIKLYPSYDQSNALLQTMSEYNAACNYASQIAWEDNIYGKYDLHHRCYREIRSQFPTLNANHVIQVIARVNASYKVLNKNEKKAYALFKKGETDRWYRERRTFKWRNGVELSRDLWGFLKDSSITVSTVKGRAKGVCWYADEHNLSLLKHHTNSATLIYRHGRFYLHIACEVKEPDQPQVSDFIGVDMGVANISVTSDGEFWNGEQVESKRQWYAWRKAQLQRVGTDSAKRRLQKLSGRENRFKRDVDHCISKHVVSNAEHNGRGIAIEELEGIHERARAIRKEQRARHHNWSFYRLSSYIQYKARIKGVPVVTVDPAYTSQMCSNCGHTEKNNRRSQDSFICRSCGYSVHADFNASLNIRNRAISTSLW